MCHHICTETRFSHYTIMSNHSTDPLYSPVNRSLSVTTLLFYVISLFLNVINNIINIVFKFLLHLLCEQM